MTSKKKKPEVKTAHKTTVTFQDEGKGLVTRQCWECEGTGRVYEGGYGMRNCGMCSQG